MAWILEGAAAPPPPPQSINPDLISQELRRRGLSDAHAQGIISNIQRESSFNPAAMGDQGTAHGLFQHRLDRATALKKAVPDWQTNWMGQVDFALNEPEGKAYLAQQFANPADATKWFTTKFERPANAQAEADIRAGTTSGGRWVLDQPAAPAQPQSEYQKNAATLREGIKRGATIPDPRAVLFGEPTDEGGQWASGKMGGAIEGLLQSLAPPKTRETSPLITDFGKQIGPAAWSGVQTISQAIAPWVTPFPAIVNPALGALDQKIASATGAQPPAQPPARPKDMSALNPMPDEWVNLFRAGQEIATKVGLGKEFDALTNMYPVYGRASAAVAPAAQWAKSKMPGAKAPPAPPPRPFGAEPSFVGELPKPKPAAPPPRKQLPSPAQASAQAFDDALTKEEQFRQSPQSARLLRQQLAQQADEPTGQTLRPPPPEAPRAAPEAKPVAPEPPPVAEAPVAPSAWQQTQQLLDRIRESDQSFEGYFKEGDSDRGYARLLDQHLDKLPPELQEFWRKQKALDQETGEWLLAAESGVRGSHVFNAREADFQDLVAPAADVVAPRATAEAPKPPPVAPEVAKVAEVAQPPEPALKPPESPVAAPAVEPAQSLAPPPEAQPAAKGRVKRASQAMPEENLSLSQWTKANGGAPARELKGEARALMKEKNIPGMWRVKADYSLNELAEMAHAQGFIDTPETGAYLAALRDDLMGKPVMSRHREGFQSGVEQQAKAEIRKQDQSAVFDVIENFKRDTDDVDHLVSLLQSDSPAVRMAAKNKLEALYPEVVDKPAVVTPKEAPETSQAVVDEMRRGFIEEPKVGYEKGEPRPMVDRKGEKLVGQRKDQRPAVGPPEEGVDTGQAKLQLDMAYDQLFDAPDNYLPKLAEHLTHDQTRQLIERLMPGDNPAIRKALEDRLMKPPSGDFSLTSEVTAPPPKPGEKQGDLAGFAPAETGRTLPRGKRKAAEKELSPLEKASIDAEDQANQYVLKDTNSTYSAKELEEINKLKTGPRGGAPLTDPPFIRGKELRHLPQEWAKAITTELPVDATGGDPIWLTRKKVGWNTQTGTEKLLPNSLVYRGIKSGEKMLEIIDEHPDQVRGIRNFLLETGDETFKPIKNDTVWKLLDTEGARAIAEDNGILTVPTGYPRPELSKGMETSIKRAFDSLTPEEKSQYRQARKWFDVYITEPLGMKAGEALSDYFPRMRETIEVSKNIEIKVGDGKVPKTLADSVPTKVKGWMERHRTAGQPADRYDIDAIHGLINGVSRRIGLSGGMDPRFGTPITGMLERINPVLESLSKEEPRLIPHAQRMLERVLGHANRPDSPGTDLILQTQALRTMGARVMPVVKNHFQKLNTFADNGPKATFQGFRDMYDPKRRAIAHAAGADFSEGALMQDIGMVKEGETWVHRRGRDVRDINDYAMWGMKWSEESNQVHAFLSALRKGEELYGEASPEAIRYARKSQSRTQFGRPSSMIEAAQTSNAGRVAFQLKRFSLAQYDFMQNQLKDPVKAARYLGGMMALFGADGFFPGLDDEIREKLWSKWPGGIFGALGTAISDDVSIFPSDAVRSIGFWLPGPAAANFFDALSAGTGKSMNPFEKGVDVGTPLSPEQRTAKGTRAIPAGGVLLNAIRKVFVDMRSINNNQGKILEPVDFSETVGYNVPSGPKRNDRTRTEIGLAALGVQSAKRRDEFKQGRELADIRQEEIRVKRDAADLYVSAQIARQRGDQDRANDQTLEARQLIKDFNTRYKGARIKLTQELIDQARKRRRYTPSERQRQSLPKDIRGIEEARPPPPEE